MHINGHKSLNVYLDLLLSSDSLILSSTIVQMKQCFFFMLFLLLFLVTGSVSEFADASPDTVSVEIAPSTYQVTIGDSLSIYCTVTYPEGVRCGEPHLSGDNFNVDISRQWQKKETIDTGGAREQFGFMAYVFSPDTLRVGPFKVDYVTAEGNNDTALSNVLTFVVDGFVKDTETAPKANRRPFDLPFGGIPLWAVIALILIAAVIAGVILYLVRRKKPELLAVQLKPIDEIGEFERIRAMKLHESNRIKELYILTSSAMRGFIHRNMGFDALYETSEEILMNLSRNSHDTGITKGIREIFEESDMVKFAKYIPPVDRFSTVIDRALVPVKKVLDNIAREKARLAAEAEAQESHTIAEHTPVNNNGDN